MKRVLRHLLTFTAVTTVAALTLSARADLQQNGGRNHDLLPVASGQYVTPTAISDASQQFLNPGLPGYPDFVAGEAVRSRLSPDGTTLAIITAGQNSLYKPDGTVDAANSTQYIFLYDVKGPNSAQPALMQVIKQANSHVGLVFSPDGNTLYAAGGSDDAVYVYTKGQGGFVAAAPIALGHFPPGASRHRAQQRCRPQRAAERQRHGHLRRRQTLVVANNYNDSISVIDTRPAPSATSTICARSSPTTRAERRARAARSRSRSS